MGQRGGGGSSKGETGPLSQGERVLQRVNQERDWMAKSQLMLDADTRREVIEHLIQRIHEHYVFPDVAQRVEEDLRRRLNDGEYDHLNTVELFCLFLTAHLQEISHDKHFFLVYHAKRQPDAESGSNKGGEHEGGMIQNFGFQRVERLQGNIGYLDLRSFYPAEIAGETAVAAMNFLALSSALIVDLRHNDGGEPSMIALLSSYLFEGEPVHLNDFYRRFTQSTQQFWTLPYVPGRRYGPHKPVFVLIGPQTASAAEEFAYNLKHLQRATLIGRTTAGGAHPMEAIWIHPHIEAFIPAWRAINPRTGTNWEGTGVEPDIDAPPEEAQKVAYAHALEAVLENPGKMPRELLKPLLQEARAALATL
jgi:retinol-binding protein 3